MNLVWLEDFLVLADSGNFSRAAEQRHMTQPAFSRRIRQLEEWLGASLFDRSTHPAGLTETGLWFRDVARDILARVERIPDQARAVAEAGAATLRFAATHALSLTFLPGWLRGMEAHASVGPVQLLSDVAQSCETAMLQGRAQFFLCHAHGDVPGRLDAAGYAWLRVGRDELLPVCAAGGPPGASGVPLPLLDYSGESGLGRILRALRAGALAGRPLQPVFTAHLGTVLRTMALEGRGVAWLPRSLVGDDLTAGRLAEAGDERARIALDVRLYRAPMLPPGAERFWQAAAGQAGG